MPRRKTQIQFMESAQNVHGDRYDYSLVEYVNSKTKIEIICKKHGIFKQTPNAHIDNGSNCPRCVGGAKKTTRQFIEDAQDLHGDKYDYSLVKYVNNKTKVNVICKEHGIFEQLPSDHIGKISGCPVCAGVDVGSTSQFIEDAYNLHGDRYDYSLVEYVNNTTKVKIICKEHGVFKIAPKSHIIKKQGCSTCGTIKAAESLRKPLEQFIEDSRKVHNDKYDYSLVEYVNNGSNIDIICPKHGVFEQTPNNHINSKYGCMQCWNENRPPWKGWMNELYFDNHPEEKNVLALFYIIEMIGVDIVDHFIKVGITKKTIKERYAKTGCGDKYLKKNIICVNPMFLYDAWVLEQKMLKDLKGYQYFPNHKFSGQTECLKPKQEVLDYITKLF